MNTLRECLKTDFIYYQKFLSYAFQEKLKTECYELLKKEIWSEGHFDDLITGFRETTVAKQAITRLPYIRFLTANIKRRYFGDAEMQCPHILELSKHGYIRPHIDQNCGNIIASISLGCERYLQLSYKDNSSDNFAIKLSSGSLYIQRGRLRYEFLHGIEPLSNLNDGTRLSIVFRSEQSLEDVKNLFATKSLI